MSSGIFLIKDNHQLIEMNEAPYQLEYELQKLLETYPNLLPGDQIDRIDPRRWLLVKREMGVLCEANGCDRWAVEFLHQQMNPAKVFTIEIKQYIKQDNKILASRVIGQTIDVKNPEYSKKIKNQWDAPRLLEKIKSQSEKGYEQALVAQKMCEWVNKHSIFEIEWSEGNIGGFYLTLNHQNIKFKPASLWPKNSSNKPDAVIQFEFGDLKYKPVFQEKNKRLDWLNKLNQISGISISNDRIEGLPQQSLSLFTEEPILQQIFQTLDWVAEEIKAS